MSGELPTYLVEVEERKEVVPEEQGVLLN